MFARTNKSSVDQYSQGPRLQWCKELTEDAHDVAALANLVLECVIPLHEQGLLFIEDLHGAVVHDVRDASQGLDVVHRRPLDDPPPERRRPKLAYMREQYPEDYRPDQLRAA